MDNGTYCWQVIYPPPVRTLKARLSVCIYFLYRCNAVASDMALILAPVSPADMDECLHGLVNVMEILPIPGLRYDEKVVSIDSIERSSGCI